MTVKYKLKVTGREFGHVLAGLRLLQAMPLIPPEIRDLATDDGTHELMTVTEIDELCERLNTEGQ